MYDTDKIETVMRYRERTKHVVDRYAFGRVELDWANQPNPFRSYAGAPARVLAAARCPLSAARSFARMGGDSPVRNALLENGVELEVLDRLLMCRAIRRSNVCP